MSPTGGRTLMVALIWLVTACGTSLSEPIDLVAGDGDATEAEAEQLGPEVPVGAALVDEPELDVARSWIRAVREGDVEAVRGLLSAAALLTVDHGRQLDELLEGLAAPYEDLPVRDLELVTLDDRRFVAVVVDGHEVVLLRVEGGEVLVEPFSPLVPPGAPAPVGLTGQNVPGTELAVVSDPVLGAAVLGRDLVIAGEGGAVPLGPLLERGDRGEQVRTWQVEMDRALRQLGLRGLTADGIFGPGTEAAVERTEEALGLPVDGVVDPALRRAVAQLLSAG